MCLCKSLAETKLLSHWSHLLGFLNCVQPSCGKNQSILKQCVYDHVWSGPSDKWKVFSLLWDILWLCRLPAETKLLSHWSHWWGLSPVCTRLMCTLIWLVVMLEKSHCEHLWGFSPEWVISCSLIFANLFEEYPHWPHWRGFIPVCVIMCSFRALL